LASILLWILNENLQYLNLASHLAGIELEILNCHAI
jgi:hypothetical protein